MAQTKTLKQNKFEKMGEIPVIEVEVMAADLPERSSAKYRTIANLNIRSGYGKEFEVIGLMTLGTEFEGVAMSDEWVAVGEGFCMKKFLEEI